jgi:hypothetical protein
MSYRKSALKYAGKQAVLLAIGCRPVFFVVCVVVVGWLLVSFRRDRPGRFGRLTAPGRTPGGRGLCGLVVGFGVQVVGVRVVGTGGVVGPSLAVGRH